MTFCLSLLIYCLDELILSKLAHRIPEEPKCPNHSALVTLGFGSRQASAENRRLCGTRNKRGDLFQCPRLLASEPPPPLGMLALNVEPDGEVAGLRT